MAMMVSMVMSNFGAGVLFSSFSTFPMVDSPMETCLSFM